MIEQLQVQVKELKQAALVTKRIAEQIRNENLGLQDELVKAKSQIKELNNSKDFSKVSDDELLKL